MNIERLCKIQYGRGATQSSINTELACCYAPFVLIALYACGQMFSHVCMLALFLCNAFGTKF